MSKNEFGIVMGDTLDLFEYIRSIDTSVHDLPKSETYQLYPNPVSDYLQIAGELSEITQIHVYDGIGQQVLHFNSAENGIIDFSKMPIGVYFVSIVSANNKKCVTKIVKR